MFPLFLNKALAHTRKGAVMMYLVGIVVFVFIVEVVIALMGCRKKAATSKPLEVETLEEVASSREKAIRRGLFGLPVKPVRSISSPKRRVVQNFRDKKEIRKERKRQRQALKSSR